MKIAVWDTYVEKKDGEIMHFDILVPEEITDEHRIYEMGKEYLHTKSQGEQPLSAKECRLCHMETAPAEIRDFIEKKVYYIIEMKGCD